MYLPFSTLATLAGGAMLLGRERERAHRNVLDVVRHPTQSTAGIVTIAAVAALVAGGILLSTRSRRRDKRHGSTVAEWIEVDVPVSTAYNQWTQFEEFPKFMAHVEEVKQLDDTHLHWKARINGKVKEWNAEITEQIPDERIAWRSTSGAPNAGVVTFHKIRNGRTRIMLQMDYEPQGMTETVGDLLGSMRMSARGDLKRFRQLIESRGNETGGWRGTVAQGTVTQH